jgi:hypothetical protein
MNEFVERVRGGKMFCTLSFKGNEELRKLKFFCNKVRQNDYNRLVAF